ncbi:MAG: hypothetical protein EPO06_04500 [Burkholderiaceae bacterium]|nr:MAG: hypothetical protein EPO06_04500 [Burkholderiaceae bacterium]
MVFSSIFGKKEPDDKDKKSRAKPEQTVIKPRSAGSAGSAEAAVQTKPRDDAAHRELAKATAKKIDQIESEMSLDFLPSKGSANKAAAPKPVAPKAPVAAPKPAVPPPSPGKGAKPATKAKSATALRPGADAQSADSRQGPPTLPPLDMSSSIILGNSIGAMALEISSSDSAPIIEEVAILYANGQGISAANALATAVREDALGGSTGQAWMMLFDLYQLLGKKDEFENLALDFVGKFESSPPAWETDEADAPVKTPTRLSTQPNGTAIFFAPILDESVVKSWEQIKKAGEHSKEIKVDFSNVKRINAAGCAFLLKALPTLGKSGHTLLISGMNQLAAVLEANIQPGRRDPSDAPWLLLLEAYRVLDMQSEFEDSSMDYCITFEVSPPAWEDRPAYLQRSNETPAPPPEAVREEGPTEEFTLTGELVGKAEMELSKLTTYSESRSLVSVNCKRLRRVDFAAGGTLLNMLVSLTSAGKRIEFNQVNHLVAALFAVMGIHELALINVKRA